jgi:hypothetical protein
MTRAKETHLKIKVKEIMSIATSTITLRLNKLGTKVCYYDIYIYSTIWGRNMDTKHTTGEQITGN